MESIITSTTAVQLSPIVMGLLGGLALFLYGMDQMTDALKRMAGEKMKSLLARLTTNRFIAAFTGTFVTAIIQSSSVTTVLVVGFVSAGLLSLSQAIGIILGADIGTTITAQIVAFKVTQYALLLVAIGFGFLFIFKHEKVQQYGATLMGLGLIFFGMELMSEATYPLRAYQPFINLMHRMDDPLVGILVGTVFTGIIQSSAATMAIIIVLASQGFVSLEAGIALALGANIGTCSTALLAAIGKPAAAVQAAVAHILFKFIGVVIWFGFIDQLALLVRWVSPTAPELEGLSRLAAEAPRQIANAHTVFNVANTFIFIWFVTPFAMLLRRLIPERDRIEPELIQPKYLDETLIQTPALALDRVRLELERLGSCTLRMVKQALQPVFEGAPEDLESLAKMDDDVDSLHGAIVIYLGRISKENLPQAEAEQLADYMAIANHLENIGDMIETNLVEAGNERLKRQVRMSESTRKVLAALHEKVTWAVEQALKAQTSGDRLLAEEVMAAKLEINRLAGQAENHLARRLAAEEPNRLASFRIETEIIEYLKRVYYFAKRIAKITVDMDLVYKQVDLGNLVKEAAV